MIIRKMRDLSTSSANLFHFQFFRRDQGQDKIIMEKRTNNSSLKSESES